MGFEQAPDKSSGPGPTWDRQPPAAAARPSWRRRTDDRAADIHPVANLDEIPGWDLEQIDRMHGIAKHEGK
jgi:hypothetical protein